MTIEEQALCSRMNNFFCALYLLVGMADYVSTGLKKFEVMYEMEKSSHAEELKAVSNLMKLDRYVWSECPARHFRHGDEKSGCYSAWKSHRLSRNEKTLFVRFKGNRFNILFLLAQYVYHVRQDIVDFLENVHSGSNLLLKQVLQDIKNDLYIAGCRSLGLLSKLVMGPLRRLAESTEHMLNMNAHYQTLVDYFDQCSADGTPLLEGVSPFHDDLIDRDTILESPCKGQLQHTDFPVSWSPVFSTWRNDKNSARTPPWWQVLWL